MHVVLVVAVLWAACAAAAEIPLEGYWRPAAPQETAADMRLDDPALQAFDPALFTHFAAHGDEAWVVLRPRDRWPQTPWMLGIANAGLQTLTLHVPGRAGTATARIGQRGPGTWPAHGRLAFFFDAPLPPDAPLVLRVDARGVIASPPRFMAQTATDFARSDAAWLAIASASFAVMLAMAAMALCFALRLRDATFLYYAVFIVGYALILALQSGYLIEPLGWTALAPTIRTWGRFAVALAIAGATLFFTRFADLPRYVRRGRYLLALYAGVVVAVVLSGFVPGLHWIGRALINPLLIVGAPLFLGIALLAAWRGSFYARLFMLGWAPLLAVTAIGSLQLYGVTRDWFWSDEASLACGALESLLFSLALAYRTLELRRAHEQARLQADIDSLTGLYNRRAWDDRMFGARPAEPLSLLFLDVDHFKRLNDRHGHHAGDEVLRKLSQAIRAELREGDVASRYGGEEFVVALPGTGSATAIAMAERIRQRLQLDHGDDGYAATVSIGVATSLIDEDLSMLLRRCDRAMYAAKKAGRNRVALAKANREVARA